MYSEKPLAERMRPDDLGAFFGQPHLTGNESVLKKGIESGNIPSLILWGPPGSGKTTLARIIARKGDRPFYQLSAISSGVKDVREAIEKASNSRFFNRPRPLLFIDEIHRFNKAQQDSLLGAVEQGVLTLIGATTENPSFEVISPLLSRCQVFILKPLENEELKEMVKEALRRDIWLSTLNVRVEEFEALLRISGGDARKLYNALELVVSVEVDREGEKKEIVITDKKVMEYIQQNIALYDKDGELHYDIISAFIKSVRGSDPNAALYWLARMVEGGEDPVFIARRLLILASEDIGLANPNALLLAQATFDAVKSTGWPECRIILAETTIFLALAQKSNSAYLAVDKAIELVQKSGDLPVPLHLRNAPTSLMKESGYGKGYRYAHNYEGGFTDHQFMPDQLSNVAIYHPTDNQRERESRELLARLWGKRYGYKAPGEQKESGDPAPES